MIGDSFSSSVHGATGARVLCLNLIRFMYFWLFVGAGGAITPPNNSTDFPPYSNSLCGFVAATNIEHQYSEWSCHSDGVPTTDPCGSDTSAWNGLNCNITGGIVTIVGINISLHGLVGTVPSSLGEISTLTSVELEHNHLAGFLPTAICELSSLKNLLLVDNDIRGSIPFNIGRLTSLITLDLSTNKITGTVPAGVFELLLLQNLQLGANNITGIVPAKIGELSSLITLDFSTNNFTGSIPSELALLSRLKMIDFYDNDFTGEISSSLCSLTGLQTLYLRNNRLKGTIPDIFSSLLMLTHLDMKDNELTGSIPASVYQRFGLRKLNLDNNFLSGTISSAIGNLTLLGEFYVAYNYISGSLPNEIGLCVSLQFINLNWNYHTGTIPSVLGQLTLMSNIELAENCFSGSIPPSIGELSGLIALDINNCTQMSGPLPSSLGKLTQLIDLYLPMSGLTGTIPSSLGNMSRVQDLYLDGNSLTGTLPSSLGSLTQLLGIAVNKNYLSGTVPAGLWGLTRLGELDIAENMFTGSLPDKILPANLLLFLDMSYNQLTGKNCSVHTMKLLFSAVVSVHIFTLFIIYSLNLHLHLHVGTVPSILGTSHLLKFLLLGVNKFSGTISPALVQGGNIVVYISMENNLLTGSIPSEFGTSSQLAYLQLNNNYLEGRLDFLTTTNIVASDLSFNQFTGTLPALPSSLHYINMGYTHVGGNIPTSVGQMGLNYLNISNTLVTGTIPSELCTVSSFSVDVSNSGIDCYSGCLTSSQVLIFGATEDCHNGTIMLHFLFLSSIALFVVVMSTCLYNGYSSLPGSWMNNMYVYLSKVSTCSCLGFGGRQSDMHQSDSQSPPHPSSGNESMSHQPRSHYRSDSMFQVDLRSLMKRFDNSVVWISFVKFFFVVAISLSFSNWWTYGGGTGISRNNDIVETCSNPVAGNCFSFCGYPVVVDVNVVDDDFVIEYSDFPPHLTATPRTSLAAQYCIANLLGYCAYDYWLIFKLIPLLLHLLQFLLQCLTWWHYKDFTPQQKQYNIVIKYMYPEVNLTDVRTDPDICVSNDLSPISGNSIMAMIKELQRPPFYSIFAFIEMITTVYVWGELAMPPIYCGSVRPLSLYYYPIFMCLADLAKFNIYVGLKHMFTRRYGPAVFALFNFHMFLSNLWISTLLAGWFVLGTFLALWYKLKIGMKYVVYRVMNTSELAWAQKASIPTLSPTAVNVSIVKNPVVTSGRDVEVASFVESEGIFLNDLKRIKSSGGCVMGSNSSTKHL